MILRKLSTNTSTESENTSDSVSAAVLSELSRRGLLKAGAVGTGLLMAAHAVGCGNEANEADAAGAGAVSVAGVDIDGVSFYADIAKVQEAKKITVAPTDPAFADQAKALGGAVASVIAFWLAQKPYTTRQTGRGLFEELFDNRKTKPVFQPGIGPVVVFQHQDVLSVLANSEAFTVDPYAPMMKASTAGNFFPAPAGSKPNGTSSFYDHFVLGTDSDSLYVTDSLIVRSVVRPSDLATLRNSIRQSCESYLNNVKPGQSFDVVKGLCRYVPVDLVQFYLGLPSYEPGKGGEREFDIEGLKAGDELDATTDPDLKGLRDRFTFVQTGGKSKVPSKEDLYQWIKAAFQNIFNNVSRDPAVDQAGVDAAERIQIWQAKVTAVYKRRLEQNGWRLGNVAEGPSVPDSMIGRLLVLQHEARTSKTAEYVAKFACADAAELFARTGDDRVQTNAFGTIVGAVANPEEANARVIQSVIRLKAGELDARAGSSFTALKQLVAGATNGDTNMSEIGKFALELLRVNPQGETLLRRCVADTVVSGQTIKKGQLVFACHGAAMIDPAVIEEPRKLDVRRDAATKVYARGQDSRVGEAPQSTIYLQHGFGRHKCLGRYASEITLQEVLRAVLRKGTPSRAPGKDLQMDSRNLYAESFEIVVS